MLQFFRTIGPEDNVQNVKSQKANELAGLVTEAHQQFPGIVELLRIYGGYEQMIIELDQYVHATQQLPVPGTSNRAEAYTS